MFFSKRTFRVCKSSSLSVVEMPWVRFTDFVMQVKLGLQLRFGLIDLTYLIGVDFSRAMEDTHTIRHLPLIFSNTRISAWGARSMSSFRCWVKRT
jgi:hypothetical protein